MRKYGIYDKPNLRKTVEGILKRMRTGLPWRDLLVQEPGFEWEFIDGSIVKAHQHSAERLL